ncbi:MAG TPA: ABC transporter ATP-binding protein [Candidatus Nanopelagicaceae bacterium]|nr:ABC transporter ATP-binding protein [Candidatus Nanopelagicaceae bacterium]
MSELVVEGLTVGIRGHSVDLLRDISFSVASGEILGMVGESGSGKTMAALAIMGLLPPEIELRAGSVRIDNLELVNQATMTLQRSAHQLTMIFQQPQAALNPTMKVGNQVSRVLQMHRGLSRAEAKQRAVQLLDRVGIAGPDRVARAYPHQLSGGMCQRVMIAIALACKPQILLADEPTTALDVTIQAQVFDLIAEVAREEGCGVILITHDLAAVSELCDRVAVLYGGQLMESGSTRKVLDEPRHPYSRFLLDAGVRQVDSNTPELGVNFALTGCRFGHRCSRADEICGTFPPLSALTADRGVSCHHPLVRLEEFK